MKDYDKAIRSRAVKALIAEMESRVKAIDAFLTTLRLSDIPDPPISARTQEPKD